MHFEIIECLRGICSIVIVIFHYSQDLLPNGYNGVDQFFIISGYLITYSLQRNCISFNIISFMNKRIKRIFPLKCVILLYVLYLNRNYKKQKNADLELNSISALLCYFNFKLINDNNNYFSSTNINLILNFWTLSVEEQYYLYTGLISLFSASISRTTFIFLHSIIMIISLALFLIYFDKNYVFSFYSIYTRLWEFSCGSLINFLDLKFSKDSIIINSICFLQLILFFSHIQGFIPFLLINLITIFQLNYSKDSKECIFSNSLIKFAGKISYSIYLVHYSILYIYTSSKVFIIIAINSILFFYMVEKPFRYNASGYSILLLYAAIYTFYNKIYIRDINIEANIHTKKYSVGDVEKYFIKDMCSYDIIDNLYKSKYNALLLGDSHVLHYIRALYDNKKEIILYHSYICDLLMYDRNYKDVKYLLNYRFDIVIIAFWQSKLRNATYADRIFLFINEIKNISRNILVISDNPMVSANPNTCLSSKYCYGIVNVNCSIVRPYNMASYSYPSRMHIYDYNVNNVLVRNNKCLLEINNIPIYRDQHHISSFFVESILMKDIHKLLNKILNSQIWIDEKISNITYHCIEKEHNIYGGVCRSNKYKIENKKVSKEIN